MKRIILVVAGVLLCAGCRKGEIQDYRVPKEKAELPNLAQLPSAAAPPSMTWILPAGWEEKLKTTLRVGSFKVVGKEGQEVDISVIPLEGVMRKELDNVNRWRAQIQMSPISASEMAQSTEPVKIGDIQGKLFNFASTELVIDGKYRARILAAMVTRDDTTWFFKMTGEDSLVSQQKPAFVQFLKSIAFAAKSVPVPMASEHPVTTNTKEVPKAASNQPFWNVPPTWQGQSLAEAGQS